MFMSASSGPVAHPPLDAAPGGGDAGTRREAAMGKGDERQEE